MVVSHVGEFVTRVAVTRPGSRTLTARYSDGLWSKNVTVVCRSRRAVHGFDGMCGCVLYVSILKVELGGFVTYVLWLGSTWRLAAGLGRARCIHYAN